MVQYSTYVSTSSHGATGTSTYGNYKFQVLVPIWCGTGTYIPVQVSSSGICTGTLPGTVRYSTGLPGCTNTVQYVRTRYPQNSEVQSARFRVSNNFDTTF